MREIKFRVWDKKKKKFCNQFADWYLSVDDGYLYKECDFDGIIDKMPQKRFIIQQFTGIKDGNNKKIYDGDIVKNAGNGYEEYWRVYFNEKRLSWYVGCDTKEEFFDDFLYEFCQDGKTYLEVVGNIFETPELLDKNVQI